MLRYFSYSAFRDPPASARVPSPGAGIKGIHHLLVVFLIAIFPLWLGLAVAPFSPGSLGAALNYFRSPDPGHPSCGRLNSPVYNLAVHIVSDALTHDSITES